MTLNSDGKIKASQAELGHTFLPVELERCSHAVLSGAPWGLNDSNSDSGSYRFPVFIPEKLENGKQTLDKQNLYSKHSGCPDSSGREGHTDSDLNAGNSVRLKTNMTNKIILKTRG